MRSLFLIALLALTLVSAKPRQVNEESKRERRATTCSSLYWFASGNITSHPNYGQENYKNSVDCIYTIRTGLGAMVTITIDDLDIEQERFCSYDSLTIGVNTTNSKKLCGTERGTYVFENVQNGLVLQFKSDSSVTARGFKITYRVVDDACSMTYKDNFGEITSPGFGYTNSYANNLDCEYTIETGAGKADVYLILKHFDLEWQSRCVYDYLSIAAPYGQSQKLCGTKSTGTTYTFRHVEGRMVLRFHSDIVVTNTGFELEYRVFKNNTNSSTPSWNSTTPSWNNTNPSWNNTIPSWNNTIPSWNNTIPSWNNTIPSWNNTIPSWNNTMPSWNNTMPSWNNTMPSWNNTMRR